MSVSVLEVHLAADGVWELVDEHPAVFSADDLLHLKSLDGFTPTKARLRAAGSVREATVYRAGPRSGFVLPDALGD